MEKPVPPYSLELHDELVGEYNVLLSRLFRKDGLPRKKAKPEDAERADKIKAELGRYLEYSKCLTAWEWEQDKAEKARAHGFRFGEPAEIEWGGLVGTIKGTLNFSYGGVMIDSWDIPRSKWGGIRQPSREIAESHIL